MFYEVTFRVMLLPLSDNLNDYVTHVYGLVKLFQKYLPDAYLNDPDKLLR